MTSQSNPKTYVIELHHPGKNRRVYFPPIDRNLRARMQHDYVADPVIGSQLIRSGMPAVIPGIQLELTEDTCVLRDPMITEKLCLEWATEEARKRGEKLPPETEVLEHVHHEEYLWWMRRLCDAGYAEPVGCRLPELADIKYTPPENRFGPKPKRGKDRLKEIFYNNPQTAADYLQMSEELQIKWKALVGA